MHLDRLMVNPIDMHVDRIHVLRLLEVMPLTCVMPVEILLSEYRLTGGDYEDHPAGHRYDPDRAGSLWR